VADQSPRVSVDIDPESRRVEQEPLNQREVAAERQVGRRHGLSRRTDEAFAREIGKQRISKVGYGHPKRVGDPLQDGTCSVGRPGCFPKDHRPRSPRRDRRRGPTAALEPREDVDGESKLLRRTLAWERLA
jgi:hypothetical protein